MSLRALVGRTPWSAAGAPAGLFLVLAAFLPAAEKPQVYRGPIVLQSPLPALEKGRYVMEVTRPGADYVLTFLQGDQKRLSVTGRVRGPEDEAPKARIPVIGAHFLRSSEDPLPTGQERQFSKTGAAQYEEEKRDWKAVMRVYKSAAGGDAWFVFQERKEGGSWLTVDFKLSTPEK
jgi:hypothetical protein